jgi:hypothetical protein
MTHVTRAGWCTLAVLACLAATACQLKRPDIVPARMIEPQLLESQAPPAVSREPASAGAAPIRLLDTQARGHLGRRVLYRQPSGELIEDPVWRWSSAPERYLDTALRLELAASPGFQLVDQASAPALAATLLVWHLDQAGGPRLAGAVEFLFTGPDRVVHTHMVVASEPVSAELPGDVGAAAGRLLRRLALEGLTRVARDR